MTADTIARLKITLDDVKPAVLRRVDVPFDIRLDRLHLTIQAAMGWTNSHLYELRARDVGWSTPLPDIHGGGDFLDARSVQRAVQGTSSVYFAYPVQDGLLDATAAMAIAAREAGITRLVNLVMLQSSIDAPTPRMRQNYLSEQVFEWAGIGAVQSGPRCFTKIWGRLSA